MPINLRNVGVKLVAEGEKGFVAAFLNASGAVGKLNTAARAGTVQMRAYNDIMGSLVPRALRLSQTLAAQTLATKLAEDKYLALNAALGATARATQLAEVAWMRSLTAMHTTKRALDATNVALLFGAESTNKYARALAVAYVAAPILASASTKVGNALTAVGRSLLSIIPNLIRFGLQLGSIGLQAVRFAGQVVQAFVNIARQVGQSAQTVVTKLHEIIANLLHLGNRTKETESGWTGAWRRMAEIAGGIFIRDMIYGISDALHDMVGGVFEAIGSFQGLEVRFENLLARQVVIFHEIATRSTETYSTWVAGTAAVTTETEGLSAELVNLNLRLQATQIRLDEAIADEDQARILELTARLNEQTAAVAELGTQYTTTAATAGHFVTGVREIAGETMSMKDAMVEAQGPADDLLNWIKETAILTPFTTLTLSNAVAAELAMSEVTAQTSGTMEEHVAAIKRLTLATGDFVAGMGLSEEHMGRIILNFQQMETQGKVTGTELRDLARGALFPVAGVFDILAKKMGITVAAAREMAKEGTISVQEFIDAFVELAERDFKGSMDRMARTITGVSSNIREFFEVVIGLEVLGPVVNHITGQIADALIAVMQPEVRQWFTDLGQTILGVFMAVQGAVGPPLKAVASLFSNWNAGAKLGIGAFTRLSQVVRTMLGDRIGNAFLKAGKIADKFFEQLNTHLKAGVKPLEAFRFAAIQAIPAGPWRDAALTVIEWTGKIIDFVQFNIPGIRDTIDYVFNAALDIFQMFWNFIGESLIPAIRDLVLTFTGDLPNAQQVASTVFMGITIRAKEFRDYVEDSLLPKLREIVAEFREKFPLIKIKVQEVFDGVRNIWDTRIVPIYEWIKEHGPQIATFLLAAFANVELLSALSQVGTLVGYIVNPLTLVLGAAGLLAVAWTENWGGIQQDVETAVPIITETIGKIASFIEKEVVPRLKTLFNFEFTVAENPKLGEEGSLSKFLPSAQPLGVLGTMALSVQRWVDETMLPAMRRLLMWSDENWPKIKQAIADTLDAIGKAWDGGGKQFFQWMLDNGPTLVVGTVGLGVAFLSVGTALQVFGAALSFIVPLLPGLIGIVGAVGGIGAALSILSGVGVVAIVAVLSVLAGMAIAGVALFVVWKNLDKITAALKGLGDWVAGQGQRLTSWWSGLVEGFQKGDWASVGQSLGEGIRGLIDAINIPQHLANLTIAVIKGIADWLLTLDLSGLDLKPFVTEFVKNLKLLSGQIGQGIVDIFNGIKISAGEFNFQELCGQIGHALVSAWNRFLGMGGTGGAAGKGGPAVDMGKAIWEGIRKGLLGGFEALGTAIVGMGQFIKDVWAGFWQTKSPSVVAQDELAKPVVEGLANGFTVYQEIASTAVTLFMDALKLVITSKITEIQTAWDTWLDEQELSLDDFKQDAKAIWDQVAEWLAALVTTVEEEHTKWDTAVEDTKIAAQDLVDTALTNLKNFIMDPAAGLAHAVTWAKDKLEDLRAKVGEVGPAFDALRVGALNLFHQAVSGLAGVISSAVSGLQSIINTVPELPELPPWWQRHSPSPVEESFLQVASAAVILHEALQPLFGDFRRLDAISPARLGPPDVGGAGRSGGLGTFGGVLTLMKKPFLVLATQFGMIGMTGTVPPSPTDPPLDPNRQDPGSAGGGGSGDPFQEAVELFKDAVVFFARAVGYTEPFTTTGGGGSATDPPLGSANTRPWELLASPEVRAFIQGRSVRTPASAQQIIQNHSSRVVNNTYEMNVSANYREYQSPVSIRDDISGLLALAGTGS